MLINLLKAQIMKSTWYLIERNYAEARAVVLETVDIINTVKPYLGVTIDTKQAGNEKNYTIDIHAPRHLNPSSVLSEEDIVIIMKVLLPQILCLLAMLYNKDIAELKSKNIDQFYHDFNAFHAALTEIRKEYRQAPELIQQERLNSVNHALTEVRKECSKPPALIQNEHLLHAERSLHAESLKSAITLEEVVEKINTKLLALINKIELSVNGEQSSEKFYLNIFKLVGLQLLEEYAQNNHQLSLEISRKLSILYHNLKEIMGNVGVMDRIIHVTADSKNKHKKLIQLIEENILENDSVFHQKTSMALMECIQHEPDIKKKAQYFISAVSELGLAYSLMQKKYLPLLKLMCDISNKAKFLIFPDVSEDNRLLHAALIDQLKKLKNILDNFHTRLHFALAPLLAEAHLNAEKSAYAEQYKTLLYILMDAQNTVRLKIEEFEAAWKSLESSPVAPPPAIAVPHTLNEEEKLPDLIAFDKLLQSVEESSASATEDSAAIFNSPVIDIVDHESPGGSSEHFDSGEQKLPLTLPVLSNESTQEDKRPVSKLKWSADRFNTGFPAAPQEINGTGKIDDADLTLWLIYIEKKGLLRSSEGLALPSTPSRSPGKGPAYSPRKLTVNSIASPSTKRHLDFEKDATASKEANQPVKPEEIKQSTHPSRALRPKRPR